MGKIKQKVQLCIQSFLLSRWVPRILYTSLGVFLGMLFSYLYLEWGNEGVHLVNLLKASSPAAILLSVMLASRQFVYNTTWNKKDAAKNALRDFVERYNGIIEELHPYINIRAYIRNKDRLEMSTLHNLMGVFVKDDDVSYRFVYHGDESQDDIKHTHDLNNIEYDNKFKANIDGRRVERAIISLLGEFEYICSGIKNDVYDKEVVKDLLASTIINGYFVFEYYIKHLRHDMRHGGRNINSLYGNFEKFAKELSNEDFEEIAQEKYIVPFNETQD